MAKQRPVPPGGRKPANTRDRQAAPTHPEPAPAPPGPRRPSSGDPSDPRPIAAPFMQHPLPARPPSPTPVPPQHQAPHRAEADEHRAQPFPQAGVEHDAEGGLAGRADGPDGGPAAGALPPTRTSGRPMPGPRPTPPAESAAPTATGAGDPAANLRKPEQPADERGRPAPLNSRPAAAGPAAIPGHDADHRRPEARNSQPAAAGPGPSRAERPGNPSPVRTGQPHRPDPARTEQPAQGNRIPATRPGPGTGERPAPSDRRGRSNSVTTESEKSLPHTQRRPGTIDVAKAPLLPGLQLQPMVHVDDMAAAVGFYEKLGGEVNHGDRSGDWVLMQVGTAQIGLVTRPPNASRGESTVELNFAATMPLDRLEQMLREQGVTVVEMTADRDLGTQLHVETPDGMPIKIHQVEPELMV